MASFVCRIICYLRPVCLYHMFPHDLINGKGFRPKKKKVHLYFLYNFSLKGFSFLILRRTEGDAVVNVYCCSCKSPVILVRFQRRLNFLDIFSKSTRISYFRVIGSEEVEQFQEFGRTYGRTDRQTDQQTDMTKLIVAFRSFANVSK